MSIAEFLTIYQHFPKRDGTVEFTVHKKPYFIFLAGNYLNNK
jgi:hypothetical protein